MNKNTNHTTVADTVSVSEAARMLGVGRRTVYDLIEWGELDAFRIRSALRIDLSALQRFQASGKIF